MEDSELREADFSQREALSRISDAKNHNILPEHYSEHFPSANSSDIQRVYIAYNRRLRMANALDFDDLLLKTVEVMDKPCRCGIIITTGTATFLSTSTRIQIGRSTSCSASLPRATPTFSWWETKTSLFTSSGERTSKTS